MRHNSPSHPADDDSYTLPTSSGQRIESLVREFLDQPASSNPKDEEAFVAAYPELMPMLARQLNQWKKVRAAIQQAETADEHLQPTSSSEEDTKGGALAPGLMLGRFQLVERIGGGAFGDVWRAIDNQLSRSVALKFPHSVNDKRIHARFIREAQLTAQLRHPNIVTVHEIGVECGLAFIVSDYIAGMNLREWLSLNRASPTQAASMTSTLAGALAYAHERGIVHRDIKPSNILVDQAGNLLLTDFGLAKDLASDATLTVEGKIIGTPEYLPPEQIRGQSSQVDQRADIYSLGVVLFELLTGERPFRGNVRMVLHQALMDEPPGPRQLSADVPRDLNTICLKCLEKEPSHRFATAKDLQSELELYVAGRPIRTRQVSSWVRITRWGLRNPATALLSLALLVALATTTVVSTSAYFNVRYLQRMALLESTELSLDRGLNLCEKGEVVAGLSWLERSLELARQSASPLENVIDANLSGWRPLVSTLRSCVHHSQRVTCLGLFPDNTRYASGSEDGTVRVGYIAVSPEDATAREATLMFQHATPITALAVSHDGQQLASAGADGTVRVWDLRTQTCLRTLQHTERVTSMQFSNDNRRLLTGSMDTLARQWDLDSGQPLEATFYHATAIQLARYVQDGRQIVIAGGDCVTLWDTATSQMRGEPMRHARSITAMQLSSDQRYLITGCGTADERGEVRLWDIAIGKLVGEPLSVPRQVSAVAISPDNQLAFAGDQSGHACLWSIATGQIIHQGTWHDYEVRCAQFSGDGHWLATGSFDGTARLWSTRDALKPGTDLQHEHHVSCLAFTSPGDSLVTGSYDGTTRCWDIRGSLSEPLVLGDQCAVPNGTFSMRVQFSRDGSLLLTGDAMGRAQIWATDGTERRPPLEHSGKVTAFSFSPDKHVVGVGCDDGTVAYWNLKAGKRLATLPHSGEITEVVCSADNRWWLSASRGGDVRLWNTESGQVTQTFAHPSAVWFIGFRPDSRVALTSCADSSVRLWDVATGAQLPVELKHAYTAWEAHFTADGQQIITGCGPSAGSFGEARRWSAATGEPLGKPMRHFGAVACLAINPQQTMIATGSFDKSVQLWDLKTGRPIGEPWMHRDRVWSVTFSPDGSMLLSTSDDGTARLWDVATGKPLGPPMIHAQPVRNGDFSADGKTIATGSLDGRARLREIPQRN